MKRRILAATFLPLAFMATATAVGKKAPPRVRLTPHGRRLEAHYAAILTRLRHQIAPALPRIPQGLIGPFMQSYRAETDCKPYVGNDKPLFAAVAVCLRKARPILRRVNPFLASHALQAQLIEASVISDGTPAGLAAFAQKSSSNEALINTLLNSPALMKQMQKADGPRDGNYGRTMQIYTAIQRASRLASKGILQRLAMGTSLQQRPTLQSPGYDPVARFLNYQKAYLKKELDPSFPTLTTWDCRMVTDDPHSNRDIDWFRTMLRNYDPEAIFMLSGRQYMNIVHTDVRYCHPNWHLVPGSHMANVLAGGGECGPRAWLGRLATRAFGIPTWGFRERAHAAMSRWTPNGWSTQLGAQWIWDYWDGRRGPVFYRESQARRLPREFMKVLRAQWVGAALGEKQSNGFIPGKGGFWYAVADNEERAIVASHKRLPVGPTPAQLARAYGMTTAQKVENAKAPSSARRIFVDNKGAIHIPAAAYVKVGRSTQGIYVTNSFLGGLQVHCNRVLGKPQAFAYRVNAPHAGKYKLVARVVTVGPRQPMWLTVNQARQPIAMWLPYTSGLWQTVAPAEINLRRGENLLQFARRGKLLPGVAIKDFTLIPVQ